MNTSTTSAPSPEVKALLKEFCRVNREKYGENWKAVLAEEMAEKFSREFPAYLVDQLKKK